MKSRYHDIFHNGKPTGLMVDAVTQQEARIKARQVFDHEPFEGYQPTKITAKPARFSI